jgi:hypothetical protein
VTSHAIPQPECFECPCALLCIAKMAVAVAVCSGCEKGTDVYILSSDGSLKDEEIANAFAKCERHSLLARQWVFATAAPLYCKECREETARGRYTFQ